MEGCATSLFVEPEYGGLVGVALRAMPGRRAPMSVSVVLFSQRVEVRRRTC